MKKLIFTTLLAATTLFTAPGLFADSRESSYTDTARVVDVEPIYETVSIAIPEERCWRRPRRHDHHRHSDRNDSYTGALAGGIIGGVVGNQFGHGSGKKAMTVAGTLLGLSIGRDLSRNGADPDDHHDTHRRRCETTTRYESRQEIIGYRVKYRYKGNLLWTRTQSHPGKRIRVRVQVRPLNDHF